MSRVAFLEREEHVVEVGCGVVEAGLVCYRCGVDDVDDAAEVVGGGVRGELAQREVAQFAVPGGVEEEEAARGFEGVVAGGAVGGGGGGVGCGEGYAGGGGGGRGVGLGGGGAVGL